MQIMFHKKKNSPITIQPKRTEPTPKRNYSNFRNWYFPTYCTQSMQIHSGWTDRTNQISISFVEKIQLGPIQYYFWLIDDKVET